MNRAHFHREHAEQAQAEAQRLWNARAELGARWKVWVATELYELTPPAYAAMVRRELERLASDNQA
ncbi:hypothetical protein IQ22_02308 [Pseudomonas duriflava]|uniref:Uncharacterized protein n=1 Tax=Pseudomonas duriflava TaxID=459528 RepID=A0A562QAF2_9PSED|nr:hypothetical protein [Pseudomonas duriflava]TWI53703.1 hypothetical protein IQ22_02308 [Pseudomonas duriflava]